MSNLIGKSARDSIGIDSPWRGIVWASLMLRAGNVHSDREGEDPNYPYKNAVRIAGGRQVVLGGLQSFITIEATLPYRSPEALADGGDFLPFVGEYFEGSVPGYTGSACSTLSYLGSPYSGIGEEMPEDDPAVDSLEKYLVWCFLLGELELLSPTPNALLPISLDFLEEAPGGASLKLSAKLFIDYHGYRASNNLVCSVFPPSVTPAVIPPPDPSLEIEWTDILNKPNFATVATSGNYANLTNRPTIPTKTSELENDSNFLDEVNYPVTSVNGMTGAVTVTAAIGQAEWENVLNKPDFADVATSGSYSDLINKPSIPTKTSDLTNDSNFLTTAPVTSVNGQTGAVVLSLDNGGGGIGNIISLNADLNLYVRTDGLNSNLGYTNTSSGAFFTPQKGIDEAVKLIFNGYTVTLNIAAGTYNLTSPIYLKDWIGDGNLIITGQGDATILDIASVLSTQPNFCFIASGNSKSPLIQNLTFTQTNSIPPSGQHAGHIKSEKGGKVRLKNINFGAINFTSYGGFLFAETYGTITLEPGTGYKISGGYTSASGLNKFCFSRSSGSVFFESPITFTHIANAVFDTFFDIFGGTVQCWFAPTGTVFNQGAFSVTAKKYNVQLNGKFVHFNGSGVLASSSLIPGNVSGTNASGGQDA